MRPRSRGRAQLLRRVARALAPGLLLVASGRSARAQPAEDTGAGPSLLLEWSGPGPELACLGEDGLKRAVNEYLGRDAFEPPNVLAVHVAVERLPDRRFRAVLTVGDPSGHPLGTREITSSSELCATLDDRLILAVALLADNGPEPAEPAPSPEAPRPPPPSAPPDTDDAADDDATTTPTSTREAPRLVAAEAAWVLESGLLPAVRPGLRLAAALEPAPWLRARAGALGFLPASARFASASAEFWLLAGTLDLCAGALNGALLQAGICAGALYAALGTDTRGVAPGRHGVRSQLAGSLGLHGGLPLSGRWTLVADLTAVFPYRPERFLVRVNSEPHSLFQMSKPSLLAGIGVAVTF